MHCAFPFFFPTFYECFWINLYFLSNHLKKCKCKIKCLLYKEVDDGFGFSNFFINGEKLFRNEILLNAFPIFPFTQTDSEERKKIGITKLRKTAQNVSCRRPVRNSERLTEREQLRKKEEDLLFVVVWHGPSTHSSKWVFIYATRCSFLTRRMLFDTCMHACKHEQKKKGISIGKRKCCYTRSITYVCWTELYKELQNLRKKYPRSKIYSLLLSRVNLGLLWRCNRN